MTETDVPGPVRRPAELGLSTLTATSPDSKTPTLVTEPRKVLVVTIPLPFSADLHRQPFRPHEHVHSLSPPKALRASAGL